MFDTHCHLNSRQFEKILNSTITDAREAGIKYILVPGTDISSSIKAINIASDYSHVYAAVGVHPTEELERLDSNHIETKLDGLCREQKVVALGETGLDYYRYSSSSLIQQEYFKLHIKLAIKYEKALIVHDRMATEDIFIILKNNWQESLKGRIVFHCSQMDSQTLEFSAKYDCFMGVDGDITYDNEKQANLKTVPIEEIILETDSPLLLPEPLRSDKKYPNTPTNLSIIAEKVAEIKGVSLTEIQNITTRNALRVFNL